MFFLILLAIVIIVGLPVLAIHRASEAHVKLAALERHLKQVELRLAKLEWGGPAPKPTVTPQQEEVAPPLQEEMSSPVSWQSTSPDELQEDLPVPMVEPERPTLPAPTAPSVEPRLPLPHFARATPPPIRPTAAPRPMPSKPMPRIDWEQFMGIKLFSWIGGLALFLGIVFFVKYAFENNLIAPATRVGLGLGVGTLLLLLGPLVRRWKDYTVLTQSLCATGVVTLYGVTYAAHAYYELPVFSTTVTFMVLVMITAAAFFLAVRLNALVVAVLGLLGGFLTPVAVSTGQDRPVALFGYIVLLDLGLMAVVLKRPWRFLMPLAAYGTLVMQIGWVGKFFARSGYAEGSLTLVPMGVALGFLLLFIGMLWRRAADTVAEKAHLCHAALVLAGGAFCFGIYCLSWPSIGLRPGLLFSYLALLDCGMIAIAFLSGARLLLPITALGTALLLGGWWVNFFGLGNYAEGARTLVPMGIELGFLLFFGVLAWTRRKESPAERLPFSDAALILGASAFGFAGFALHWSGVGLRPWLTFGYVAVVEILVFIVAWRTPARAVVASLVGAVAFLLLGIWSMLYLTPELLTTALVLYVGFGLLGVLAPLLWNRYGPKDADRPAVETPWITPLAIAMCGLPLLLHPHASGGIWLAVLCLNITGLIMAKKPAGQLCQAISTGLTLIFSILWLAQLPTEAGSFGTWLLLLGGLALFLLVQGGVMQRRSTPKEISQGALILAVAWPFLLLAWAEIRLSLMTPHVLFTAMSVLGALLLTTAWWRKNSDLALWSYLGTFVIQALWLMARPVEMNATALLWWQAGFGLIYFAMPFLRPSQWSDHKGPWLSSGLALLLQSLLMYVLLKWQFPNFVREWMGVLPAGYAVLAGLGLWLISKQTFSAVQSHLWRLAWFGSITLFFFTAIFPLQFHRQWITISWALEGAALIWLFRRVPHRGFLAVGYGLLVVAFLRLAVNPAILEYSPHQSTPIWNWFLYAYSISAAAMYFAARWWPAGVTVPGELQPRPVLFSLMGITLFVLVNLEIADFFTPATQAVISFDFTGNLARDVSYSIAWALFGLGCLVLGFWHRQRGPRYAGLGLLAVTLLKLFFHDLAQVQSVYRIVALIGVALIVLMASFLYQRFFARSTEQ